MYIILELLLDQTVRPRMFTSAQPWRFPDITTPCHHCTLRTCEDCLHHSPVERAAGHVFAPVLLQALVGSPQVVPGDLAVHVVRHMNTDVVAKDLHPAGVVTVHSA